MLSGAGALPAVAPQTVAWGSSLDIAEGHLTLRRGLIIPALPASQGHCDDLTMSCLCVQPGTCAQ